MIGRVRELKQWLDSSFYHPGVLATVAAYNTGFGKKFDDLFVKALGEIKNFGQALEEMGGTILTTVDGVEVTVEHVAAIEEKQLLQPAGHGGAVRHMLHSHFHSVDRREEGAGPFPSPPRPAQNFLISPKAFTNLGVIRSFFPNPVLYAATSRRRGSATMNPAHCSLRRRSSESNESIGN